MHQRVFDVLRLRPMLTSIPTPLCAWLTLLAQAVPNRSVLTFLELLVGAMITDRGFVTEALLAITPRRKWPTYFKWLEGGKWSWIAVAQRLCKILVTHFAPPVWYLVIDDTLVPRASKTAPDVGFHFDHSRKPNRSRYIWGQGWVTLAAVVHAKTVAMSWAVPLISRLVRKAGNHGKLTGARVLLRVVRGFFGQGRLLLDTWFMRASVITFALDEGLTVIGQVRKDLALYRPSPRCRRPAPSCSSMVKVRSSAITPPSCWRNSSAAGRSAPSGSGWRVATVRPVWTRREDENGLPKAPRLLISTEITRPAREIIDASASRWTIEPMFCA